jgi:FAD synthetase
MATVMVFGTFDILHRGHEHFLRQAKKHGKLIAVVARNTIVRKLKGKPPVFSERKRVALVRALGIAAKVVLGDKDYSLRVLEKYKPDVICLGYDQRAFAGFLAEKRIDSRIIFLKPFKAHIYKSSLLKKRWKI